MKPQAQLLKHQSWYLHQNHLQKLFPRLRSSPKSWLYQTTHSATEIYNKQEKATSPPFVLTNFKHISWSLGQHLQEQQQDSKTHHQSSSSSSHWIVLHCHLVTDLGLNLLTLGMSTMGTSLHYIKKSGSTVGLVLGDYPYHHHSPFIASRVDSGLPSKGKTPTSSYSWIIWLHSPGYLVLIYPFIQFILRLIKPQDFCLKIPFWIQILELNRWFYLGSLHSQLLSWKGLHFEVKLGHWHPTAPPH